MTAAVEERPTSNRDAALAAAVGMVVTRPGLYPDLPAEAYHLDPVPGGSLSSTGARKMLGPDSCPALYRYWADNPQPYKREFSFGHAAHCMVLGAGPKVVVIDAGDWRTKDAREQRDAVLAAGDIPVLPHENMIVREMAARLREHPMASQLFEPGTGIAEASIFWADPESGVRCRARLDWLRHRAPDGRVIVPEYKTCVSASLDDLQKVIADRGYNCQAAHNIDGLRALGLADDDAQFVFVCQMKSPPYLVTVATPDRVSMQIGRFRMREAKRLYAECMESGRWPGFSDQVEVLPLPRWIENEYRDEEIW